MSFKDIEKNLYMFSADIIGDSMNFYDNIEFIESELSNYSLGFLDFEDIMNYLVKTGYHFYGDFVTKGKQTYALVCYDAVLKFFSFNIKLDSDENNEDMKYLRKVINKHYNGLMLPDNNRALSARLAQIMVLSGRGRYCPVEKVIYSTSLLEEVFSYIILSEQSTFYYLELFSLFQGRFLAETNITNSNFLHGILKYLYFDDFRFERDLLIKKGEERQDIDARIIDFIKLNNGKVTKNQIKEAFPGINEFVISFVIARVPELIQWDYNEYNHISNISCDLSNINYLSQIMLKYLNKHNDYLSSTIIYNAVKLEYPQFILKNNINNSLNLFYLLEYYFSNKYRFKYPHIIDNNFPVSNISISSISKVMLKNDDVIKYSAFVELAESLGWAGIHAAFSEFSRNYIRISYDEYIRSELFNLSEDILNKIKKQIYTLIESSGYFAISSIFSYESFPYCRYKWNGFLLESIIEEYDIDFKVISPQVHERRYQKGIIVSKNAVEMSFEDIVISLMKDDKINRLSEIELQKYLRNKGLITNLIPQELYECEKLPFKNDMFTVKI